MSEPPCPRCGADLGEGVRNGYCAVCQDVTAGVRELDATASLYGAGVDWYFDRSGHKITMRRWAWLSQHKREGYYRIAEDTVDLYWISTVWIGLDMGLSLPGAPPLIFETMTLLAGEGLETYRWPTEAAALAGHDRVVAEVRDQLAAKEGRASDS